LALSAFCALTTAYSIYPLNFPAYHHIRDLSQNSGTKLLIVTHLVIFALYGLIGSVCYFTFTGFVEPGIIFNHYPSDILNNASHIGFALMIVFTLSIGSNHLRTAFTFLFIYTEKHKAPFMVFSGIVFSVFITVFSSFNSSEDFSVIIGYGVDLGSVLSSFLFPLLFYLKKFGFRNHLFYSAFSILMLLMCLIIPILILRM
jgi:hypothetical protein